MKLQSLEIKGYKNLKDLSINFINKEGITLLVGNNGCGKSNILEALSAIFSHLYDNSKNPLKFDYNIKYAINNKQIGITYEDEIYTFNVDEQSIDSSSFYKQKQYLLPKNIIANYSGESLRLWENFYFPHYDNYMSKIRTAKSIAELSMIYINRYNIDIALLTLFFYDFDSFTDIRDLCNKTLNIKRITKIILHYDAKKISQWRSNEVIQLITNLNPLGINSADSLEITCEEFKEQLAYLQGDERRLFTILYAATMPKKDKVITDIGIELELNNGTIIKTSDLSEGEKKLLLMTTILEALADENSLLLFDEPDAHIHICRKVELKELICKYTNRECIITTHSPTLAMCFEEQHVIGLKTEDDGTKIISSQKSKIISELTEGLWNVHEQNVFLASTKPITLLVEGKTDKIHIEEAFKHLKGNYTDLDFDCFYFGGANNIPQFLTGLKTCEIDFSDRKIIAVFDNDTEGRDCCNRTQVKYSHDKNKYGLYAITLPTKSDATIENLYDNSKYNSAFQIVVQRNGFNGLVSQYSENITKQAKIELSNMAKSFALNDFDGFKPLFDIIDKIRQL